MLQIQRVPGSVVLPGFSDLHRTLAAYAFPEQQGFKMNPSNKGSF